MLLPELFENFGHITHEPRSDGRDENFGCRTKLAEKEGRGRPNSFRIFRCRSRRDTRRRKQTLKWRQTFFLSIPSSVSLLSFTLGRRRESERAHMLHLQVRYFLFSTSTSSSSFSSCLICPPRGFHSVLAPSICTSVKQDSLPLFFPPTRLDPVGELHSARIPLGFGD